MKKFKVLSVMFIMMLGMIFLSACGGGGNEDKLKKINGVTYENVVASFNGEEHQILVSGTLPKGVSVIYTNNTGVEVGNYTASAVLSGEGYETLTLTATLSIVGKSIEGISFNNVKKVYNGQVQQVLISGNLPEGVKVVYTDNESKSSGYYYATATLSGKGYETLKLTAVLEIVKADISNVTLENKSFQYDGSEKQLFITGDLPEGVFVSYENNKATEIGNYVVTATLKGDNYNEKKLTAVLTIKPNYAGYALNVVKSLFVKPNVWEFLPESLSVENKVESGFQTLDFSAGFVNVNAISKKHIGRQLNVVYENLLSVEKITAYLDDFYTYSNIIVNLYQTFLNDNPDNFAVFEKNTENFSFKIEISNGKNLLFASFKSATIELEYDLETNTASGRVQLTDNSALKYKFSKNKIDWAVNAFGVLVGQLSLEKTNKGVSGYVYEFMGVNEAALKTTTLIDITTTTTLITSNKREIDDLVVEAVVELYDNKTGNLIVSKAKETNKIVDFETIWFNLYDIDGIESVKKVDEQNSLNLDTIYVNNSVNPFQSKRNNFGFGSRQFDIEMREVYYFVFNEISGKYEKIKVEIPMFFVQQNNLDSYKRDAYSDNKNNGIQENLKNNVEEKWLEILLSEYDAQLPKFEELKESVNKQDVIDFIGTKNDYFN